MLQCSSAFTSWRHVQMAPRKLFSVVFLFAALGLSIACAGGPSPTGAPPPQATPAPASALPDAANGLQVILAASHLAVGQNRFPIGLVRDDRSVKDAQVHLKFYDLSSDTPTLTTETDAPFYGDNLGEAGVYVGRTTFSKAGNWGVEVSVAQPGYAPQTLRVGFQVALQGAVPKIGDAALPSKNLTLQDVGGDRSKISSSDQDDSILHRISIADALKNGKPTVILFATPKFCTSRTCGPSHQVVLALAQNYADQVNFIHVEVYKDFKTFAPADAMVEWHLDTEPWLFFVGGQGKIVDRYEGGITSKEIVPAFLKFIGQ